MPPEQFGPDKWGGGVVTLTPAADIYAAAATAVHLMLGHAPFSPGPGKRLTVPECKEHRMRDPAALSAHIFSSPSSSSAAASTALTPGARDVLAKCLAPRAADRYATAAEVLEALGKA